MSDLIRREDVIKAFAYSAPELFANREWFEAKVMALPSAEAVSREDYHNLLMASNDIDRALRQYQAKDENQSTDDNWIPVKKHGMPHNEGLYIVTLRNWYGAGRCAFYDDVEILPYGREGWDKATAWMPLPKPYREENEE